MNKQRSFSEQLFLTLLLTFGGMLLYQHFYPPKTAGKRPEKPAISLQQAFAGLASPDGSPVAKPAPVQVAAELKTLNQAIADNPSDGYAYSARLRAGLIEQYGLNGTTPDTKAAIAHYDEIIHHAAADQTDAQAIYQKGDILWRESTAIPANNAQPSKEAAQTLEQLIHRGRGSSQFLKTQIFVPRGDEGAVTRIQPGSATQIPARGFTLATVNDLKNIRERVNQYYSTTTFYQIFDVVVKTLGDNPRWSYGLTIIFFAIITRILLQPLTKRQYDSMKGMALVAPESKKIQEKYKGKTDQASQMAMMKEVSALNKRHGVNPMLGCGLMLIQAPLFIFVVSPFIQHYEAKMELAGASFLWIQNLAGPDVPLLILYSISQFLSIRLSSTPPADEQQRTMQLMTTFIFPFIFPFFLLAWPSAFTMYWMTFNIISTIFQWRMMKAADPTKSVVKQLLAHPFAPISAAEDAAIRAREAVPARPDSAAGVKAIREAKSIEPRRVKTLGVESNGSNGSSAKSRRRAVEVKAEAAPQDADAVAVNGDLNGGIERNGNSGTSSNGTRPRGSDATRRARRRRRH